MYRLLYSFLIYLALPLILLRLAKRSFREKGYRRFLTERFGWFRTETPGEVIWIHAVSAGETIAAVPLVQWLVEAGYRCLITNMTPAGRDCVSRLLGEQVENCYVPYDLPGAVSRFLNNNRPCLLLTIDTELWPNTMAACAHRDIPTALVNGRMSARSAAGYARFPLTTWRMLRSMSLIAVQTEAHAQRFKTLGADPEVVQVTGSIKFDAVYDDDHETRTVRARKLLSGRPVLLAASTHKGEEEALVACLSELAAYIPDILLVIAPRHVHRSSSIENYCEAAGFGTQVLSQTSKLGRDDSILILDVMGELESYLTIARVAFVGGSLVPIGGHNLLEAVRAGAAVVMGPHLYNVEDIAQEFVDRNAMCSVTDIEELHGAIFDLMLNEDRRTAMVVAAAEVLDENRGAIQRNIELIRRLIGPRDEPRSR